MSSSEDPVFFATQGEFREWLASNHDKLDEQWVGFYKKASKIPSITWPESVDEALCFGWIDGLRKSIDEVSYKIRFTPRRPGSHWSAKNLSRIVELIEAQLVEDSGLRIYEARDPAREKKASYEQKGAVSLPEEYEEEFRANGPAWEYFQNARPSYRKTTTWWVVSAKREATRLRRLRLLIESSEAGTVIPQLRWAEKGQSKG